MSDNEMEDELEDVAGFFISDQQLVIEFGDEEDPKSVSLEFQDLNERMIVQRVLDDRNFWTQIINALSAALTQEKA